MKSSKKDTCFLLIDIVLLFFKNIMKTQKTRVLELLQKYRRKWVWCYEFAMKYGILRYWAYIHLLRKEWYNIIMKEKREKELILWQRYWYYKQKTSTR